MLLRVLWQLMKEPPCNAGSNHLVFWEEVKEEEVHRQALPFPLLLQSQSHLQKNPGYNYLSILPTPDKLERHERVVLVHKCTLGAKRAGQARGTAWWAVQDLPEGSIYA